MQRVCQSWLEGGESKAECRAGTCRVGTWANGNHRSLRMVTALLLSFGHQPRQYCYKLSSDFDLRSSDFPAGPLGLPHALVRNWM